MQPIPPPPPTSPDLPREISIQTTDGAVTIQVPEGASPQATYEAAVAARRELRQQLERVKDDRLSIAQRLRDGEKVTGADREGLETRLRDLDARIIRQEAQLALADAQVVRSASIPGAVVEKPAPVRSGPPDEVIAIPIVFTIFVLAPLAIAYARRIWKRGATVIAPVPKEVTERLEAMGQAVESIAVEVERIGEGQRFITRVMSERPIGAGAAQPMQVSPGERISERISERIGERIGEQTRR
jgi:hypothetical protein